MADSFASGKPDYSALGVHLPYDLFWRGWLDATDKISIRDCTHAGVPVADVASRDVADGGLGGVHRGEHATEDGEHGVDSEGADVELHNSWPHGGSHSSVSHQDRGESLNEVREGVGAASLNLRPREGRKDDAGKRRYDLIPVEALREVADVYTMGAKKYDDNNWRHGMAWHRIIRAAMEHFEKWRGGEVRDLEDGQHHLASVVWCCLTLMTYEKEYPEGDDRWKRDAAK